jgi:hypothetical protein
MPASRAERAAIAQVVQQLSAQFSMFDRLSCSASCRTPIAGSTVIRRAQFAPILDDDFARDRLRVTGQRHRNWRGGPASVACVGHRS